MQPSGHNNIFSISKPPTQGQDPPAPTEPQGLNVVLRPLHVVILYLFIACLCVVRVICCLLVIFRLFVIVCVFVSLGPRGLTSVPGWSMK